MDASAWVALAAAAFTLGLVFVGGRQAKHAESQAKAAQQQAETAQAQAESAKRQADAAVRQTELQEQVHHDARQPYVWVDIQPDSTQGSILRLVVRNEGPTVAEDVRVTFNPPLMATRSIRTDVGKVQERLASGLRSLRPGREMVWYLGLGRELFAEDADDEVPREYRVNITGRGPFGDMPLLTYIINVDDLRETADPRLGSLDHVTRAIEKVAKHLRDERPANLRGRFPGDKE